jgi:hypothetical protein
MKKNIIFLSLLLLLFICGIFYNLINLLSKDKLKDLETLTIEKSISTIKILTPFFNKAIEVADDINLLTIIESVTKTENVTSCFILDKNTKVLIHNNINEWNTEKNSDIYNNAINQKTEFLQKLSNEKSVLFSKPLINNCTLFCTISTKQAQKNAKLWKIKYFTIGSVVVFCIIIILYFLSKLLILMPFNRTKKVLENTSLQDIKNSKYNEITEIFDMEREQITKKIKTLEENNKSFSKIIEYLQQESIKDALALILLNSFNEVIYAYDYTGNILGEKFKKGSHILETTENFNLVQIIVKANEAKGKEIRELLKNHTITAISINDNNKIIGTIIKIK